MQLYGGGIQANGGSLSMTDCTITGNTAGHSGGGIAEDNTALSLVNCTIADNVDTGSASGGGGVFSFPSSDGTLTFTNCTIVGNMRSERRRHIR